VSADVRLSQGPPAAYRARMGTLLLDREYEFELEEEHEAQLSPTRLFTCSDADRTRVNGVLGRTATNAQLRNAVAGAITLARADAGRAIRLLRARPRTARTTATYRGVFNVPPTFVPDWRPSNARWRDHGELVALRLERAAAILGGGHMHLFCAGTTAHCPECTGAWTSYSACSSYRGRYLICLGSNWWLWHRQGRRSFMAGTMLHEALHVYFKLEHHRAAVGRPSANNVHCYPLLVGRLNGRPDKPLDVRMCRRGRTA
jgi:hypothetical protein